MTRDEWLQQFGRSSASRSHGRCVSRSMMRAAMGGFDRPMLGVVVVTLIGRARLWHPRIAGVGWVRRTQSVQDQHDSGSGRDE